MRLFIFIMLSIFVCGFFKSIIMKIGINKSKSYKKTNNTNKKYKKNSKIVNNTHEKYIEYVKKCIRLYDKKSPLNTVRVYPEDKELDVDLLLVNTKGLFCIKCEYNEPDVLYTGGLYINLWGKLFNEKCYKVNIISPFESNRKRIVNLINNLNDSNYTDIPVYNVIITNAHYNIVTPSNVYTDKKNTFIVEGNKILIKTSSFSKNSIYKFIQYTKCLADMPETVENIKNVFNLE